MHYLKSLKRGRLLVVFHRKENSGSESFPAPGMDGNDRTRIWELPDSNQGLQTPSTSVAGYTFFLDDIRTSPSFLEDCGLPSALVVWKWFGIFSLILVYLEQVSFLWVSNGLIKLISSCCFGKVFYCHEELWSFRRKVTLKVPNLTLR